MHKAYTTLNGDEKNCPTCGSPLMQAIYYTGRVVKSNTKKDATYSGAMTTTTTTTTISYDNITPATGAICIDCGKKYERQRHLYSILAIVMSVVVFAIGTALYVSDTSNWIGGMIALIGVFAGYTSVKYLAGGGFDSFNFLNEPESKDFSHADLLSACFIRYFDKSKIASGHHSFSTSYYRNMNNR